MVQQERLAAVAAQLAGARELAEAAPELLVDDACAVAGEGIGRAGNRQRERVHRRLPGQGDLDRDPHNPA